VVHGQRRASASSRTSCHPAERSELGAEDGISANILLLKNKPDSAGKLVRLPRENYLVSRDVSFQRLAER